MTLFRYILSVLLLLSATTSFGGTRLPENIEDSLLAGIDCAKAGRKGDTVSVTLTLRPDRITLSDFQVLTILPSLVAHGDTLLLPAIHMLGRLAYYRYLRHDHLGFIAPSDYVIWEKRRYRPFAYAEQRQWQHWMDRASLRIEVQLADCRQGDFAAQHVYQVSDSTVHRSQEVIEATSGSITDRLTIVFPVNRTEVLPEFHDNRRELDKIRRGLEEMAAQPEAELRQLTIKGFASPEGTYDNNVRLARGRTDSIGAYVLEHFHVPADKIHTEYEPEDWQGLIACMESAPLSRLPHRAELLRLARRQDLQPDEKERIMKRQYPADWRYLLDHCMPTLRHTDYRLDYTYFTPEQILKRRVDTVWAMRPMPVTPVAVYDAPQPYDVVFALKTNVLFDLACAFNGEIEVPIGRNNRWSLMGEFWKPWFVWHHNSRAYQLQILGGEVRYWLGSCRQRRPKLTGWFVGPYYAWGKYDFEWGSTGDQGEFHSIGVTAGYVWPIHRRWNLELSASVGTLGGGWLGGERRHYHGEFDDTHLIWRYTTNSSYTGPTKLKVSLAWLIGRKCRDSRKEARR